MLKKAKGFIFIGPGIALALLFFLPRPLHTAAETPGTWQSYFYHGAAGSRPYFVYTPAGYQNDESAPLFVMLHGCLQTPMDFAASTQMNHLADQYHFIVVYPQQTLLNNPDACWQWFYASNQSRESGEPAIIAGITQTVEHDSAHWKIDTRRVYVAGVSAGAGMAVILGATYPDLFTAIGVHSGPEYKAVTSIFTTNPVFQKGGPDPKRQGVLAYQAMGKRARVVPTIVLQGTDDIVATPINGDQVIQQWMQTDKLASHNKYQASFAKPSRVIKGQVPNGHSYSVRQWNDKRGNEIEEYWLINGMRHAWSGGSLLGSFSDPAGPSASQALYRFFMKYKA